MGKNKYPASQSKVCAAHTTWSETDYNCKFCIVPLQKAVLLWEIALNYETLDSVYAAPLYWVHEYHLYSQIVK
jgi:hypothetical protein